MGVAGTVEAAPILQTIYNIQEYNTPLLIYKRLVLFWR